MELPGTDPAELLPPHVAKRFGRATLLGQGGMGTAYQALDLELNRQVVIKLIRPGLLDRVEARKRFEREVVALARLNHPNIVRIYDYSAAPVPYYVMERVDGVSLADQMLGAPLSIAVAVETVRQLALALDAVHLAGMVHRDLTPANVMITSEYVPKLIDFGLAKDWRNGQQTALTGTGFLVGTPAHVPPEVYKGEEHTCRSDVYQLGALFYLALTGRLPYADQDLCALFGGVSTLSTVPPSTHRPEIDAELDALVLDCIALDPIRRLPSAANVARRCELWSEIRSARSLPRERTTSRRHHSKRVVPPTTPRSSPLVYLLVVAALAGGLVAGLRSSRETASRACATPYGRDSPFPRPATKVRPTISATSKSLLNFKFRNAVLEGHLDHAAALLDAGANIDARVDEADAPILHRVVQRMRPNVIRFLLERGANPHLTDKGGKTAFHWASLNDAPEVMPLLVEYAGPLDARDGRGDTLLHTAASGDNVRAVQALIDAGANENARDKYDATPLYRAAQAGSARAAQALIAAGADESARNCDGETPLHIAALAGHLDTVQVLVQGGADIGVRNLSNGTPLHRASQDDMHEVVAYLAAQGAPLDATDDRGSTPLHKAARAGNAKTVRILLERGARSSVVNRYGESPAQLAQRFHHTAVVDLLVPRR